MPILTVLDVAPACHLLLYLSLIEPPRWPLVGEAQHRLARRGARRRT